MLGMHGTAYANKAMVDADLIFSVGSRFDDRIVGSYDDFGTGAVKMHLDIDPAEIDKVVKVDCSLAGDAKAVLLEMLPLLERGDVAAWNKQIKRWKREFPLTYRKEGRLRPSTSSRRCTNSPKGRRWSPPTSGSIRCGRRSSI